MLKTLILKELQNHVLGFRFLFTLGMVMLLALGTTAVRVTDYAQRVEDASADRNALREGLEDGRWWQLSNTGLEVQRPLRPLQVIAAGAETGAETRAALFAKRKPLIRLQGTLDQNPLLRLFPPMDLVMLTGVVMSLLVLVLSFDAVSGEREEGTLRLLLSYPVPRGLLMLAKWLGGMVTLSLAFLVAYLAVGIWLLLSPRIGLEGVEWGAFFLIGGASLLYIGWMFSGALFVSSLCRQSATAMCLLLLGWVLLVLVVPNLVPLMAEAISPATSRSEVAFRSMEVAEKLRGEEWRGYRDIQKRYGVRRWWQDPAAAEEGVVLEERIHDEIRRQTREVADPRHAELAAQEAWAAVLGRVSPYVLYTRITTHLAGTGLAFERDWRRQLRQYEDDLRAVVTQARREDWPFEARRIPAFRYEPPPLAARFMERLTEWVLLAVGSAVFFLGSVVRVLTLEVTE